jgi:hypothetical protein
MFDLPPKSANAATMGKAILAHRRVTRPRLRADGGIAGWCARNAARFIARRPEGRTASAVCSRARAVRRLPPFWHPTCSDLLRIHRDNEVPNVASRLEFRAHAPIDDRRGRNPGATVWSATAFGADKVTFLTSWFAQAEHGGFLPGQGDRAL